MFTRHYIAILSALLILVSVRSANSDEIEAKVLQVRNGEVCLNVGMDDLIFPGAPYYLLHGKDTVVRGRIDNAQRTISTGRLYDEPKARNLSGLRAFVRLASIDSNATITLSTPLLHPELIIGSSFTPTRQNLISQAFADASVPIVFKPVDTTFLLGAINVTAGDTSNSREASDVVATIVPSMYDFVPTSIQIPAPMIVALIPNLSSPYCARGELTTSLYQRFDFMRYGVYAPGMKIDGGASFVLQNSTDIPFGYDPEKGRQLFRTLSPRPKELVISVTEPVLQPLAAYLADLLARDQCRVRIESNPIHWDFAVCIVPYLNGTTRTLESVIAELAKDTSNPIAATTVRTLSAKLVSDTALAELGPRHAHLSDSVKYVNRVLISDYGCFPLFRPELVVRPKPYIRNIQIAPDDPLLDFSRAYKVTFPKDEQGATP